MSDDETATEGEPSESPWAGCAKHLRPLLPILILLTLLTGVLFPLILGALAQALFHRQATGSLIVHDGVVVGSDLIGQEFSSPKYFQPRPSAAGDGYDAASSGGTNFGPNSPKLANAVAASAAAYRKTYGVSGDVELPIDAVTASGSGLDPHISPANARLQAPRVAKARGLSEGDVHRLIDAHTQGRQGGLLGEPRVAVLPLNLALDRRQRGDPD